MRPVGPIRLMPMAAHPPRVATAADLARIAQFNRTETPFPDNVTLQALIEAQLDRHSDRTAVICDHDSVLGVPSLTYAQLNGKVNQLAHVLRAAGVGPGHIVALLVERSFRSEEHTSELQSRRDLVCRL